MDAECYRLNVAVVDQEPAGDDGPRSKATSQCTGSGPLQSNLVGSPLILVLAIQPRWQRDVLADMTLVKSEAAHTVPDTRPFGVAGIADFYNTWQNGRPDVEL